MIERKRSSCLKRNVCGSPRCLVIFQEARLGGIFLAVFDKQLNFQFGIFVYFRKSCVIFSD